MKKIYNVECPNGHVRESWLDNDVRETLCPECGEVATRLVSAPQCHLNVTSGDFPGAKMKWLKHRERQMVKEKRTMADHDSYV